MKGLFLSYPQWIVMPLPQPGKFHCQRFGIFEYLLAIQADRVVLEMSTLDRARAQSQNGHNLFMAHVGRAFFAVVCPAHNPDLLWPSKLRGVVEEPLQ